MGRRARRRGRTHPDGLSSRADSASCRLIPYTSSAAAATAPGRSADWLLTQGRDAVNVAGGMHAWAASGRPVVYDSGAPGVVA